MESAGSVGWGTPSEAESNPAAPSGWKPAAECPYAQPTARCSNPKRTASPAALPKRQTRWSPPAQSSGAPAARAGQIVPVSTGQRRSSISHTSLQPLSGPLPGSTSTKFKLGVLNIHLSEAGKRQQFLKSVTELNLVLCGVVESWLRNSREVMEAELLILNGVGSAWTEKEGEGVV